jgi:uncharacterized SAM-binding protein YcdF (DUF218 family)
MRATRRLALQRTQQPLRQARGKATPLPSHLGDQRLARFTNGERGGIFFRLVFLLFLACLVFAIYLVRHPLMRLAGNFWVVDDGPAASDAIVILGDDNYEADRANRAAEVLKQGWAPRIIASGRYLRPYASIAQLEQQDLLQRGVPASAIVLLQHRAEDTREEGEEIGQFISSHGWKRILVVTSNYHTRRARYILARVLPAGTVLRVLSAPDVEYDPDDWWQTRLGIKRFFHESVGMIVAMWELRHQDARTTTPGRGWLGIGALYPFSTTPSQEHLQPAAGILSFRSPQNTHAIRSVVRASCDRPGAASGRFGAPGEEKSYVAETRREAVFRRSQCFESYAC